MIVSQLKEYKKESNRIHSNSILLVNVKEKLSDLIRRRINQLGLKNADVARLTGLSRGYIGNIVNETAPTQNGQSFYDILGGRMKEHTNTGLKDRHGNEIKNGDFVSLGGNMTADDSMGLLPNGWTFDETDEYQVYWDERCQNGGNWSLKIPDTALNLLTKKPTYEECYNLKYMNHAVGLLHSGDVEIVDAMITDNILGGIK